jgi:hypothetical protein
MIITDEVGKMWKETVYGVSNKNETTKLVMGNEGTIRACEHSGKVTDLSSNKMEALGLCRCL